jgi:hypothetical protein
MSEANFEYADGAPVREAPIGKMRRGRHRTPTAVLKMRGTAKNIENRSKREGEPENLDGLGEPPLYLSDEEKKVWFELINLIPPGVLASVDQVIVEQLSCLLYKMRLCHWDAPAGMHARMTVLLGLLGMTPADRSRVKVVKRGQQATNPYDD